MTGQNGGQHSNESMRTFLSRRWAEITDEYGLVLGTAMWLPPTLIIGPLYLLHWAMYYSLSAIHKVVNRA